jgi:hypothetical protein
MAKKTTVSSKKTSLSNKKTTKAKKAPAQAKKSAPHSVKNTKAAGKNAHNMNDHAALAAKHGTDAVKLLPSGVVDEYKVDFLPIGDIDQIREYIQDAMELFTEIANNNLTQIQRRRKIGAGVRNYGFIEKVADLAEANPQYAQFFDPNDLRNAIMNFDLCRNLALQLQGFLRQVTNTMLIYSNEGFLMSSIFYNAVQTMSRRGDSTAAPLFGTLRPFFRRSKRANAQPTEKQALREAGSLLKGTKDGKLIIENIKPKLTGGVHKVVEEKFTDTEQFTETKNGRITE